MSSRRISFRLKLAAGMSMLALAIVTVIGTISTELHNDRLEHELLHKGDIYVQLLGRQLEQVVAFDDRATAREVFTALASDGDLESVAVYAANGKVIESHGKLPARFAYDPHRRAGALATTNTRPTFAANVRSLEGPVGTVLVELDTTRLDEARQASLLAALVVAAVTAVLAFVIAWLFARTITRRIERISATATRIAGGALSEPPIDPGAQDEVGLLATAFNSMVADLRATLEDGQRAAEHYRLIAESTSAIPFTYDFNSERFVYVGPQASRILGVDAERWLEHDFLTKVIAPEHRARVRAQLRFDADESFECEFAIQSANSRRRDVRMVASRSDTAGERRVRGMIIDMTERKQLEQGLAQAHKLESVGRLAAGVAHEINTPVQFVCDSVKFAREAFEDLDPLLDRYEQLQRSIIDGVPADAIRAEAVALAEAAEAADLAFIREEAPQSLDLALEGLGRVTKIVRSMKAYAHPDHDEMETTDLNQAIQSTLTIGRNEYKYVADLETHFSELPRVQCNIGEINQALLNIVVNAAHAIGDIVNGTTNKGRITVTTRRDGDNAVISISDTGGGIPESVRDRMFDPFFTTKEVGRGTGQGLSIAHSIIVEKHRGSLTFDTQLGCGTTFHIRLPISSQPSFEDVARPQRVSASMRTQLARRSA